MPKNPFYPSDEGIKTNLLDLDIIFEFLDKSQSKDMNVLKGQSINKMVNQVIKK